MDCCYRHDDAGCQFSAPENELIKFSEKHWCKFHLPMKDDLNQSPKALWNEQDVNSFNSLLMSNGPFVVMKNTNGPRLDGVIRDLKGVVFPGDVGWGDRVVADFSGAEFHGNFNLFPQTQAGAMLFAVSVDDNGGFQSVRFENGVIHTESFMPHGHVASFSFKGVKFHKSIWIYAAVKNPCVDFSCSVVDGSLTIHNAVVNHVKIESAEIKGQVDIFGRETNLVLLSNSIFHNGVRIKITQPEGSNGVSIISERTKFLEFADFSGNNLKALTDFSYSHFHKAPLFYECKFHQNTSFKGASFTEFSGAGARAYRTLKLAMGEMRNRNDEALFYSLEQRSLRYEPDISKAIKITSWLYEKSSDYGRSFVLPVVHLLWVTAFFHVGYSVYGIDCLAFGSGALAEKILSSDNVIFTITQVVRPFSMRDSLAGTNAIVKLFAIIQSIVSLSLVALFLLALRWQFKRE